MDLDKAFLKGKLDQNVYMEVPENVPGVDRKYTIRKSTKALYKLKQDL